MSRITQSVPIRYFLPFDAQGALQIELWVVHAWTYLRRNGAVAGAMMLVWAAAQAIPHAWLPSAVGWLVEVLWSVVVFPFGLMTTTTALLLLDTRFWRR